LTVSREDVTFTSRGATLRGWLYRPERGGSAPGVVMAHGYTAVKEMFQDDYAAAFAAAGLVTLAYDHYGFGASDGEPRQYPAASIQLDGYRDAIGWLRGQTGVAPEHIGIWGTSNSGGHVIVLAAEELPIRCAVAQVPGLGEGGPGVSPATASTISAALAAGRLDEFVPAVSATRDGLGIMFEDGAYDWFTRVAAERAPRWRDQVRIGALTEGGVRPIDRLRRARVPLLLVVAPRDRLTPPGPAVQLAAMLPAVEIAEIGGSHFDAYEAEFAASSQAAIAWFRRFLMNAPVGPAPPRRGQVPPTESGIPYWMG
jgi:uncharacterized protein